VHLGNADCVADLRLAQIEEVAQRDDPALPGIEGASGRRNKRAGDSDVVQFERLWCCHRPSVFVDGHGRAERRHQRGVALQVPRNAERIAAVAEMTSDLTLHARGGIRSELTLAAAPTAVDGGDQRHVSDLNKIVERLSAAGEAARDPADERKVALDHPSACTRLVAGQHRLEGRHEINAKSFSPGLQ
jgi:hypothetical protein